LTQVERVKGITYSLDTLLGVEYPGTPTFKPPSDRDMSIVDDHEFANVNGIEYSLYQLIGTSTPSLLSSLTSGITTPILDTPPSAHIFQIGRYPGEHKCSWEHLQINLVLETGPILLVSW